MKELIELVAVAAVVVAAVLLAARVTRPTLLPPEDESVPATYPDDEPQQEKASK